MYKIKTRHIQGFTFIEIMVAVVIMALVGAMSVPVISTLRQKVNETRAQRNLQHLADTLEGYWVANNTYPSSLQVLTQGVVPYIDSRYTTGLSNYKYSLVSANTNKYEYEIKAEHVPTDLRYKTFLLDQTGKIKVLSVVATPIPDEPVEDPITK